MANEIRHQSATLWDVMQLAEHMRAADRAEAWALGHQSPLEVVEESVTISDFAIATYLGGELAVIWGVNPVADGVGIAWALTTDAVDRHPVAFWRACREQLPTLRERYRGLVNAIDARYTQAIRWARRLGFHVAPPAPFGLEGLPFSTIIMEGSRWAAPQ
jgi:hypothetical protein